MFSKIPENTSRVVTGLGILVAKVLVVCALSNYWVVAQALQWPGSELPHVTRKLEVFLYMYQVISLL